MTDDTEPRTIDRWAATDMVDALHSAPSGYYDGMADPAYALESAGGVVIWWAGPTTRVIAERNVDIARSLYVTGELEPWDEDDPDTSMPEDLAWELIARDEALADLEDVVADAVEAAERAGMADPLESGAIEARTWFRDRDLDRIADTVIVERGVWSKGPRITFRALGW